MEPAKLNPPDPSDAKLEALLREPASDTLPDDGFSLQVMARLADTEPVRRAALVAPRSGRFPIWSQADLWIAGAAGVAALILIQLVDGPAAGAAAAWRQIEAAFSPLAKAALDPQLLLVLGVTAGLLLLMSDEGEEGNLERPNH